jgi:hypothetical protein
LKDTFKNDPEEMNRILMDTRINKMDEVKLFNFKNNPFYYSDDEPEEWAYFEE